MNTDVFTDLSGSLYVLIQPDHKNHLGYLLKLMQTPGSYLSWTPGMRVFPRARLSAEGNVWENAKGRPWEPIMGDHPRWVLKRDHDPGPENPGANDGHGNLTPSRGSCSAPPPGCRPHRITAWFNACLQPPEACWILFSTMCIMKTTNLFLF